MHGPRGPCVHRPRVHTAENLTLRSLRSLFSRRGKNGKPLTESPLEIPCGLDEDDIALPFEVRASIPRACVRTRV